MKNKSIDEAITKLFESKILMWDIHNKEPVEILYINIFAGASYQLIEESPEFITWFWNSEGE